MAGEQNKGRLRQLAQVLIEQPNPLACQRCLDGLEDYCSAQLRGIDGATYVPEIAFHLDTCVACSEVYAVMYELLLSPAPLAEPPAYPAADLGFLRTRAEQNQPDTLRRAVGDAVVRSGRALRLKLSQGLLDLIPPPAPALALRAVPELQPLFALQIDEPDALIEELLVVAIRLPDPNYCDLRVRVTTQGRAWPDLEGISVRLRIDQHEQHALSDSWGEVLYRGLDRSKLRVLELLIEAP